MTLAGCLCEPVMKDSGWLTLGVSACKGVRPHWLGQLVSCDCSLQNSKNDFPDNVSIWHVPPFQVCLCLWGSWLSLLASLKRMRCSLYYG